MNSSLSSYENAQKFFSLAMLDDALVCIVNASKEDPDDDKILELHAKICYALKDFEKAEPLLRRCLQNNPMNAAIVTRMIDVLMIKQDYKEAIRMSLTFLSRNWKNQDIQAQLVDSYIANGQPEEAVAYLEGPAVQVPSSARNLYHLAKAYLCMGQYEKARLTALHCLKQSSRSRKAMLLLADIYVKHVGETNGSADTFALLRSKECNELLCKILIRENRIEYLELFCAPQLAAAYTLPTLYALAVLSLEAELFAYAEKLIAIYFRESPTANKSIAKYGDNCFDRNEYRKALICFAACLVHDPDNSYYVRCLGECLLRSGDPEKALSVVDDFMGGHEGNRYIEFLRAKILCQKGSYEDALAQISQCLSRNPNDARSNSFAGYVYYHLGLMDLAMEYTRNSLRVKPYGNFYALNNLALISYKRKDLCTAEKYLRRAVSECPNKMTVRINLARVQMELGKLEEAYRTVSFDFSRQISYSMVFDILSCAIEEDKMELARKIVDSLPHDPIRETDYAHLFRIVSGEFSKEASYKHIDKHFWDDRIKNSHSVFLAEPMSVYNVLKDLSQFPCVRLPAGIRKYRIPYKGVGYRGGKGGNRHVQNFLTVITALNEEYIITAYPSD